MKYFPFLTVSILLYCSDSPLYGQLSYPVPSGVYCSCGPTLATGQGSVAPAIAAKPFVKGILVRIEWDLLEPTDNNFNWVQLDTQIARAKSYGKKVALGIVNGKGAPGWLYAIAGVQPVVYNNGADTIPLPWDTAYLRQWQELIVEAGRRYLNDTTITLVHMTNSSFNGFEFQLPPEGLVNWSLFQYTEQKIIDSWKTVVTSFGAAFPHHYLDNDFHPVFLISSSSSTPADSVYLFARGKIGQRYGALAAWWTQNNVNNYPFQYQGLLNSAQESFATVQFAKNGTNDSAAFGQGGMPGALSKAIADGIGYWEIWNQDILNSKFDSVLTAVNNLITGIGFGGYSEGNQLPAQMAIANYPNPFNPSTNIHFKVTERSPVGITIVNMLGEVVADLHQGILDPGEYTVRWEAAGTASGVYLCVVNTGKRMLANKMLLKK